MENRSTGHPPANPDWPARSPGATLDWYAEYLESPHWQKVRQQKLVSVNHRCERCGAYARRTPRGVLGGLDVHHLTYERRGQEHLDDLEVLCFHCHAVEHGQPADDRTLARRREHDAGLEPDELDLEIESWDKLDREADLGLA